MYLVTILLVWVHKSFFQEDLTIRLVFLKYEKDLLIIYNYILIRAIIMAIVPITR